MILHIASINIQPNSGMGRVAYEWQSAFKKAGHNFSHIGMEQLAKYVHPLMFGWHMRKYIIDKKLNPSLILAHEPAAGFLKFKTVPLVVVSHGIEERAWQINRKYGFEQLSLKSKMIPPAVRFYSNNAGFKKAAKILLLNNEDARYLVEKKKIAQQKITVFQNGYYPFNISIPQKGVHFLFNASWIARKGIHLLADAFNALTNNSEYTLTIAGSGKKPEDILPFFKIEIRPKINVLPFFEAREEAGIYTKANVFLMPSYFEGQSLALTQAMAMGLCPVASANCGQLDFIQHNKNGLLFSTGNASEFKCQLELLLSNPETIKTLGNEAALSVAHLTWPYAVGNVVKECEAIM